MLVVRATERRLLMDNFRRTLSIGNGYAPEGTIEIYSADDYDGYIQGMYVPVKNLTESGTTMDFYFRWYNDYNATGNASNYYPLTKYWTEYDSSGTSRRYQYLHSESGYNNTRLMVNGPNVYWYIRSSYTGSSGGTSKFLTYPVYCPGGIHQSSITSWGYTGQFPDDSVLYVYVNINVAPHPSTYNNAKMVSFTNNINMPVYIVPKETTNN